VDARSSDLYSGAEQTIEMTLAYFNAGVFDAFLLANFDLPAWLTESRLHRNL
jgi:hypothetical protein